MIELILDGGTVQALLEAGDNTGVLSALNTPSIKVLKTGEERKLGYASNATMGEDLGQKQLGAFLASMRGAIKAQLALGTAEGEVTAELLESFVQRFNTTPDGVNFANEDLRAQVNAILTGAGVDPTPYLALGYSLVSPAQNSYQRDATQADIDAALANLTEQNYEALVAHVVNEIIITATSKAELLTALDNAKTYVEAN